MAPPNESSDLMSAPEREESMPFPGGRLQRPAKARSGAVLHFRQVLSRHLLTMSVIAVVTGLGVAHVDDCVSGLKWVHANAKELNIDNEKIIIAGESGGGNLTIATSLKLKQDGDIGLIKGLYALCPYIAGHWPLPENPSSVENEGILLSLHSEHEYSHGAIIYGIDAYKNKDPLAWPSFATEEDVKGLPKTYILVNEMDPLRDEGVNFYRLLRESDVDAQCRQVMGSVHGTEIFLGCPEISDETALSIANFVRN